CSLLNPDLEFDQADYVTMAWLPVSIGFLVGGFSLRLIDILVHHLHLGMDLSEAEGIQPKKKLSKTALLFLAITIHNFPEGLALGVTFGALASSQQPSVRSEEHTSELQSRFDLVCRLLLEKKNECNKFY